MIGLPLGLLVGFVCDLRFPFRFTSTSGLLWFCTLKRWGFISASSLSTECVIWEYNPSTTVPVVTKGIAGVGGSHFHIICSRDFALSFVSAQSLHLIKCVCIIVGMVSMNFSILTSFFFIHHIT